ncbi:H+-ATPase G subunit [Fragilariopsis cylindrus CCMP1102]|uniref:V-type proton ATPase subunit G n=1 Tax=Fragilariopsis cylindrus CCMP1102 TaxID=635003 RepID=A0A1E7ENJ6_9STRA|nr:H+-ATPase G subunit [Fragilariopsis cylindrus CCMP1102]|eukprot:OEU07532.1 H+-ATPase G subunit [Fragilariopsis cylindrus CCMP1102]
MSTGAGIQELMAAETRASQIVAEARLGRGDRMKQAKADGQDLISTYRAEKQEEFNNMVLSKGGSEGSASAKLQSETNKDVADMEALFQKNAQKAVDVLLSKCCEVSLEVPTARVRATRKEAGLSN